VITIALDAEPKNHKTMFITKNTIRMHDVDIVGILYFPRQFRFVHEALEDFLTSEGIPFDKLLQEKNFLFGEKKKKVHAKLTNQLKGNNSLKANNRATELSFLFVQNAPIQSQEIKRPPSIQLCDWENEKFSLNTGFKFWSELDKKAKENESRRFCRICGKVLPQTSAKVVEIRRRRRAFNSSISITTCSRCIQAPYKERTSEPEGATRVEKIQRPWCLASDSNSGPEDS